MFSYTATTEGTNKLGLREIPQTYADGFWHPVGINAEHRALLVKTAGFRDTRLHTLFTKLYTTLAARSEC